MSVARRLAIALAALVLGSLLACSCLIDEVGGDFTCEPREWRSALSPAARELLERSLADLPGPPVDYHTHLLGLGDGGSGIRVNPKSRSWLHPILKLKFEVFLSACAIDDPGRADAQFRERLIALARESPRPGRHLLLAFDGNHRDDGAPNEEETEFFVPNDAVIALAREHPDLFAPAGSIHPYRRDAIAELERCAAAGVRVLKWLPSAMNIDPASERCDAFYARCRELGVAILSHAGREEAVDAEEAQKLGNPLRLRRALESGVRVIVGHCATLGLDEDLDDPARPLVPSFDLFLRMMGEPRWKDLLFGEISATTEFNRDPRVLRLLLERADLHPRLMNASDYPIPAVDFLIWLDDLADEGFITEGEADLLREIYGVNPLLFDLALKRALRHPETAARFPPSLFAEHPAFPLGPPR